MKWGKEKVGQRDEQKCHCNGAPPPKVLQYPVNCPFGDASVFSDLIDRKIDMLRITPRKSSERAFPRGMGNGGCDGR